MSLILKLRIFFPHSEGPQGTRQGERHVRGTWMGMPGAFPGLQVSGWFWTGLRLVPFARTILYNGTCINGTYHIWYIIELLYNLIIFYHFLIYNVKCKVRKVDSRYLAIRAATNCPHQTWPNKTPATRSNTNKSHSCSHPFQCFLSAFTKHVKFLSLVDESRYI